MVESTDKLPRKEREREAHRREILAAAETVFGEKGYHNTTVKDIAEAAEFSVGTLYNLFENKEDIYVKLIEQLIDDFMQGFDLEVLAANDPGHALSRLVELRLSFIDNHAAFVRAFFAAVPGSRLDPSGALPPSCREIYDRYLDELCKLFHRTSESTLFGRHEPVYQAVAFEGILNGFGAFWAREKPTEPLQTRVNKVKAFLGLEDLE